MSITGELLLGARSIRGTSGSFEASDPTTGNSMAPSFGGASIDQVDAACTLAARAFDGFREVPLERRAAFLEAIAENILAIGDDLILRCMAESGLPRPRLEGERGRTVGQLRMFAAVVRDGGFLDVRIDPAQPQRSPLPRVDLRLRNIPIGPVAVFGASNFPLAFSVAGGDTASAFAAGCPVVAKAHPAHPGTSELIGRAIQAAVQSAGLPEGVFSLIGTSGIAEAQALVANPHIAAVGFTGSQMGGTALMKVAAERPRPIPVYAEMSSINPVILLPEALAARGSEIATSFVASLTLGAGQFCTNPGLVLAIEGQGLDQFVEAAASELRGAPAATMLTSGIHEAYGAGTALLADHPAVATVARGLVGGINQGQAGLFVAKAADFLVHDALQTEVFGASALVVRCADEAELRRVLEHLEGQLTAAIHLDKDDTDFARRLLPILERLVGRILVNGFGTGVEVGHAMVHGGPFPATSDGRTTSVGSLAIRRFLRPVSYQDLPETLLPDALKWNNPLGVERLVDGKRETL
ncbi:NADP-dependent aldehyde dehydrogenase [Novosphingobium sp. PhB55]|uniref:aldehyde dehydrogenase (NADP(+)) n=1 Tax=Novosphingobium sp. PhB55 TaxID=2485106 RepID=UPI0010647C1E|nr:aldehyde dehydrogenase (NADP(+)) [Novosphingobium sp. PhB55]TDW67616.1 NADP-dependent aldehyde dehydrogenase [Novosphingobium sp. PhB55]